MHTLHLNMWDTMIIVEEGNLPHPWFPHCEILVPLEAPNSRHPNNAQCTNGVEQKHIRLVVEEA